MTPEDFLILAKAEQERWINPVGRLILAAASIEKSVNDLLQVLAPSELETWRFEEFSARVKRISEISKSDLSDKLCKALKDQKRKYWPVMTNRNAIAHNPFFIRGFGQGSEAILRATICHQHKDIEYDFCDLKRFADQADSVAAELMKFAINFPKALQDEIDLANALLAGMHLRGLDPQA